MQTVISIIMISPGVRKIFAIISALITGGLSIAMVSAGQIGHVAASNMTGNMTANMTGLVNDTMAGSISAFTTN